jgi:hypothetical protein
MLIGLRFRPRGHRLWGHSPRVRLHTYRRTLATVVDQNRFE